MVSFITNGLCCSQNHHIHINWPRSHTLQTHRGARSDSTLRIAATHLELARHLVVEPQARGLHLVRAAAARRRRGGGVRAVDLDVAVLDQRHLLLRSQTDCTWLAKLHLSLAAALSAAWLQRGGRHHAVLVVSLRLVRPAAEAAGRRCGGGGGQLAVARVVRLDLHLFLRPESHVSLPRLAVLRTRCKHVRRHRVHGPAARLLRHKLVCRAVRLRRGGLCLGRATTLRARRTSGTASRAAAGAAA